MPSCRDGETPFWSFAIYFNCSSLIEASEIKSERMLVVVRLHKMPLLAENGPVKSL